MGYQESFRPIQYLAESAGIRRAIEQYDDNPHIPEYCLYCCTAREKATGKLFACIIGQRCRVHIAASLDLDYLFPQDEEYADYYEDLDESLVDQAAGERPDLADKAYEEVAEAFEREAERGEQWERELREEACSLWPEVAKVLLSYGPMPSAFFERYPAFGGHFMWNVLVDLERQGLVESDGELFHDGVRLTDKALGMLGVEGVPPRKDADELMVRILKDVGPVGARELAGMLGISAGCVRGKLRKLTEEGKVIQGNRGRVLATVPSHAASCQAVSGRGGGNLQGRLAAW